MEVKLRVGSLGGTIKEVSIPDRTFLEIEVVQSWDRKQIYTLQRLDDAFVVRSRRYNVQSDDWEQTINDRFTKHTRPGANISNFSNGRPHKMRRA